MKLKLKGKDASDIDSKWTMTFIKIHNYRIWSVNMKFQINVFFVYNKYESLIRCNKNKNMSLYVTILSPQRLFTVQSISFVIPTNDDRSDCENAAKSGKMGEGGMLDLLCGENRSWYNTARYSFLRRRAKPQVLKFFTMWIRERRLWAWTTLDIDEDIMYPVEHLCRRRRNRGERQIRGYSCSDGILSSIRRGFLLTSKRDVIENRWRRYSIQFLSLPLYVTTG